MMKLYLAVRLYAVLALEVIPAPCTGPLGPAETVRCALHRSLDVRQAEQGLKVLTGRRVAAGTWLPGHPLFSLTLAERRRLPDPSVPTGPAAVLNWHATLSQEIEVAGQRRARLDGIDAEAAAQVRRVAVAAREAAAAALSAYYELLGTREELHLAQQVGLCAQALSDQAAGRARQALLSPVDADVVRAEAVRIGQARFEAERRQAVAQEVFSRLLDLPGPQVQIVGTLEDGVKVPEEAQGGEEALVARALLLRGEVAAAEMERKAFLSRVTVLRRERIPNLTLSVFGGQDEFSDRILGGGLSLPLPLPSPVGPGRAGEIAEALARAEQGRTSVEAVRRRVQKEVREALFTWRSRRAALSAFPEDLIPRLPEDLRAISRALSAGRLPVREALLSQRTLIELLQAHVQARVAHALARMVLWRAAGLPFEGETP